MQLLNEWIKINLTVLMFRSLNIFASGSPMPALVSAFMLFNDNLSIVRHVTASERSAAEELCNHKNRTWKRLKRRLTFPPSALVTVFSWLSVRLRMAVQIFCGARRPLSTLTRISFGKASKPAMWHGTAAVPSMLTTLEEWLAFTAVGGRRTAWVGWAWWEGSTRKGFEIGVFQFLNPHHPSSLPTPPNFQSTPWPRPRSPPRPTPGAYFFFSSY